jgi:hypothetical protein
MVTKRLVLLLSLCSLLAITKLSSAEITVIYPESSVDSNCRKRCYEEYREAMRYNPLYEAALDYCADELSRSRGISYYEAREICSKRDRDRAREEYEMCLLSCQ